MEFIKIAVRKCAAYLLCNYPRPKASHTVIIFDVDVIRSARNQVSAVKSLF